MNKNFTMGLLLLLILLNGWAFTLFKLPFYQEGMIIVGISIILMTVLHERFVFLYAITLVLSYGAFLTIHAFINHQTSDIQLLYMYDHLLFTSFILLFWILLNYLKTIGYENSSLKEQVELLQKYNKQTDVLTINEFQDQAKWVLASVKRNNKQAWLVDLVITYENKHIQRNLQELLEGAVLTVVRKQFDLVTSTDDILYILLRDTEEAGVDIVLNRLTEQVKSELNFIEPPYQTTKIVIDDENMLNKIIGGSK